jgi:hypothetical protein
MNENRRQILEMIAAGKINADEGERLMVALENEPPAAAPGAVGKAKAKYIRVTVDAGNRSGKTPTKVNIRVPVQLLRSGVRLAGLIPAQARVHVENAMNKEGFAFDLSQIRPENLEEIVEQLQDLTIDVDDDDTKVRIFTE